MEIEQLIRWYVLLFTNVSSYKMEVFFVVPRSWRAAGKNIIHTNARVCTHTHAREGIKMCCIVCKHWLHTMFAYSYIPSRARQTK
jgi:hypothetical protein